MESIEITRTNTGVPGRAHDPMRRTPRRFATPGLALTVGAATVLGLAGCQSPPTTPEINQQYDTRERALYRVYRQLLAACDNEPDPGACEVEVRQWYMQRRAELEGLRDDALRDHWDDLEERRDKWEDEIREMFPDFPNVKDIIEPIFSDAQVTIDISGAEQAAQSRPMPAGPGDPAPSCRDLAISGALSMASGFLTTNASVGGTLCITGSGTPGAEYSGQVLSGQLTVTLDFGQVATLDVVSDPRNTIITDSTGQGWITLLFTLDYSQEEWNAILPYYSRYQLPITYNADGSFGIVAGPAPSYTIMPHVPDPISDYNGDGVLDYATDYAAFLDDLSAQEPITDMNVDGFWNAIDMNMWTEIFQLDQSRLLTGTRTRDRRRGGASPAPPRLLTPFLTQESKP